MPAEPYLVVGTSVETPYPNDCLIKPFSSRELIARVSARLDEHFGTVVGTQRPVRRLLDKIALPIAVLRRNEFIVENANRAYFGLAGGPDAIGKPSRNHSSTGRASFARNPHVRWRLARRTSCGN